MLLLSSIESLSRSFIISQNQANKNYQIIYSVQIYNKMDQDFFGGDTPVNASQPTPAQDYYQPQQQNHDQDEFDFGESTYQTPSMQNQGSYHSNSGSYNNLDLANNVDAEVVKKIQEQEQRIQKSLREKSDIQYEQKRKRKQEGKRQLQDFIEKKQKQTQIRKQENKAREQLKLKQIKKLSEEAGWKKVSANVSLKQGESKAKKDTNRMRQAILNKRMDESDK